MLLILREEIICAIILSFIIMYYLMNKVGDKKSLFPKMMCYALVHVIFDIITVITVNNQDIVPESVNWVLHVLFYASGILFIFELYNYIIDWAGLYRHRRILRYIGCAPLVVFGVSLFFLKIEYVEGNGTNYSYGSLVFVAYGLFILYGVLNIVFLLIYSSRIEPRTKKALVPMIIVMFVAIVAQAIVPELLMTGAAITFVCIGMFVSLDNPDRRFKEQALWDFLTKLKNRNSYDKDMEKYIHKYANRRRPYQIGFLVADMNGLKKINDNYGHIEGDKLLVAAANILKLNLESAENVYRLGGDEFVAIYILPDDKIVASEIRKVKEMCTKTKVAEIPLSMAIGYSAGMVDERVQDIFDAADQIMYEDKMRMKGERLL